MPPRQAGTDGPATCWSTRSRRGWRGGLGRRRHLAAALTSLDSELAQQLVRDPYVFDHLALSERAAESRVRAGPWTGCGRRCWRSVTA